MADGHGRRGVTGRQQRIASVSVAFETLNGLTAMAEDSLHGCVSFDERHRVTGIDHRLYIDPAIFSAEMARIFSGSPWVFLGLEQEVLRPGEFLTTYMGDVPVLIARDEDNVLRIFENVCTHRGSLVERRPRGCAGNFRCLYHNWSFSLKGELTGVPKPDSYGESFSKRDYPLPAIRAEVFAGLIFGSCDPNAPGVADYLAELGPIIAETMRWGKVDLLGRHRSIIDANWKLFFENTVDAYHAENLHRPLRNYIVENANYAFPNGHGLIRRLADARKMASIETKKGIAHDSTLIVGDQRTLGVFPNLLMLGSPSRPAIIIRQLIPKSAECLELVVYYASPAGLSPEEKERAAREICSLFGPAGAVSADDAEAMQAVQRGARARYSRTLLARGLDADSGTAASSSGELSLRGFYEMWARCMSQG